MRGTKAAGWKRGALEARRRGRANATALSALWLIAIKGGESEGSESRVHALDLSDVASRVRWRDDVAMVDVLVVRRVASATSAASGRVAPSSASSAR